MPLAFPLYKIVDAREGVQASVFFCVYLLGVFFFFFLNFYFFLGLSLLLQNEEI